MKSKRKVLVLADFLCATGFAQAAHNIVRKIAETGKYEIDVIGINYDGDPIKEGSPHDWVLDFDISIYPAVVYNKKEYHNPYGIQRFVDMLNEGAYDIAFAIQDLQLMQGVGEMLKKIKEHRNKLQIAHQFTSIIYYPVDSHLNEEWVDKTLDGFDFPITYTDYAVKETNKAFDLYKHKLKRIYHGVNTEHFYPLKNAAILKNHFLKNNGLDEDTFIFMNINRNQPRKDIGRTMLAYSEFKKRYPETKTLLYLHMNIFDHAGSNLTDVDKQLGLTLGKDWSAPRNFSENQGYTLKAVNELYNIADCVLSTTLGEGWGFSMTEAMATKTPVLFPANTAPKEIIGSERGFLFKCGSEPNLKLILGNRDFSRIRPASDVEDLVQKMKLIYDNYDKPLVQDKIEAAYEFAQKISWDHIGQEWVELFNKAFNETQRRNKKEGAKKVGRNEPCPNHPEKKFKKCCGK